MQTETKVLATLRLSLLAINLFLRRIKIDRNRSQAFDFNCKETSPVRLQRMFLQLQSYDLEFVCKRGKELFVADALSCAYIHQDPLEMESDSDFEVLSVQSVSISYENGRITARNVYKPKYAEVGSSYST